MKTASPKRKQELLNMTKKVQTLLNDKMEIIKDRLNPDVGNDLAYDNPLADA